MVYYGFCYDTEGKHGIPVHLEGKEAVISFIIEHLEVPKLIITDAGDNLLLLMQDGVDLFNHLEQEDISLNLIIAETRKKSIDEYSQPSQKPKWERLYDQIGLSPCEIRMRQRVKAACLAANTVRDVAELVRGTYFDAHFYSSDGQRWYRYFDAEEYTATLMIKDETGKWIEDVDNATLAPSKNIRHLQSSEDIHNFELLESND